MSITQVFLLFGPKSFLIGNEDLPRVYKRNLHINVALCES